MWFRVSAFPGTRKLREDVIHERSKGIPKPKARDETRGLWYRISAFPGAKRKLKEGVIGCDSQEE